MDILATWKNDLELPYPATAICRDSNAYCQIAKHHQVLSLVAWGRVIGLVSDGGLRVFLKIYVEFLSDCMIFVKRT